MSATCPTCNVDVPIAKIEDGRCPDCDTQVEYRSAPLPDTTLKTIESFNRRAVTALSALSLADWEDGFLRSIRPAVERYGTLGLSQQGEIFRIVNRYQARITDRPVCDYSANHAKGYA